MTNYRALLTDLLAWAEKTSAHYVREPAVIIQAREALEQPEPEVSSCPYIVTGDEGTSYCRLAEANPLWLPSGEVQL